MLKDSTSVDKLCPVNSLLKFHLRSRLTRLNRVMRFFRTCLSSRKSHATLVLRTIIRGRSPWWETFLLSCAKTCYFRSLFFICFIISDTCLFVPTGSPSGGGDVPVLVFYINQPSLPTPFYSVLVSVSVFMVVSTVFHSIYSPNDSPLSHSVLLFLFLP